MAIEKKEDLDGNEVLLAVGNVEQMSFKKLDDPDKYQNTHKVSIRVGDDWVNGISIKVKEDFEPSLRVNCGNNAKPDWQTVEVGDTVRVIVTSTEYNGKTNYWAKSSGIKITKKGAGAPASGGSSGGNAAAAQQPRQQSASQAVGIAAGNARTSAVNFMKGKPLSDTKFAELVEWFAVYTFDKKVEYASKNPKLNDYEVGVTIGQAVTSAAQVVKSLEDVDAFVDMYTSKIVPASVEGIKNLMAGKAYDGGVVEKEDNGSGEDGSPNPPDEDDDPIPF